MIIVRVPLRISFVGGGSDLPAFYEQSPGKVISMAINKYVFVAFNEKFDGKFRIGYSVTEIVGAPHEVKNTRVRAALEHFGVGNGLEIVSMADVPSSGSGLGASSSFSVALVHGLAELMGNPVRHDRQAIAEGACHLELSMLKERIGKQDQYAAAFGGINVIEFAPEKTTVTPVKMPRAAVEAFKSHLLCFHVGGDRSAAEILKGVSHGFESDKAKFAAQKKMVSYVEPFRAALVAGKYKKLGEILHNVWLLKKKSHSLSHKEIDGIYAAGRRAGAWGGKLLGAGGGGFMLFIAPPKAHAKIRKALSALREMPIGFDRAGSTIIFNRYSEA